MKLPKSSVDRSLLPLFKFNNSKFNIGMLSYRNLSNISAILLSAGGNLRCFSDKKGNNQVWTGNSIHNCCANKGGKSWSCPSINGGAVTKCSTVNQGHCP